MAWYDHVTAQKKQNATHKYVGWKVWLDDGSTFQSSKHHPDDVPATGLQFLMKYRMGDAPGHRKSAVYADVWGGVYDPAEFYIPGRTKPPPTGTWVDDDKYLTIRLAAMADFEF